MNDKYRTFGGYIGELERLTRTLELFIRISVYYILKLFLTLKNHPVMENITQGYYKSSVSY
jgi:hypothetical protein